MAFEPRYWVWVNMRKNRFPSYWEDQCNAYKVELLGEYSVNAMFSISNIWLFDIADDSRANPLEERGNDVILASTPRDPLEVLLGLLIRLMAKRFKEAINKLLQDTWAKVDFESISKNEEQALINLIYIQEEFVGEHPDITEKLK